MSLLTTDVAAQCSMCRSALRQPEAGRLAGAIRSGIVILLVAPIGVFGAIAAAAVYKRRRFEATQDTQPHKMHGSRVTGLFHK
jgi:hypothetical protein